MYEIYPESIIPVVELAAVILISFIIISAVMALPPKYEENKDEIPIEKQ